MARLMMVLVMGLIGSGVGAQSLEKADALNAEQKYEEAVAAYREVLAADSDNGQAWYGLGRALQSLKRYDEALDAFERAGAIGFQPGGVLFRKGTIHLEMGDYEKAQEFLTFAAENGVPVYVFSKNFPSFEMAKDNEEFQSFLRSLAPCSSEAHGQFDFWIGDWDVYNPGGQKVGVNTIEKILDGCVIYEDWTGAGGGAGRSFNRWDEETETWNQHWVNSSGNETVMSGKFGNGKMILETHEGVTPKQRWTWYEIAPGKVRQKAEQTTDGENWQVTWDSVYIPKGTAWEPVELD